ncbi:RNA polymerase sigma factor [Abyssisolibacter fermentans]|uniref:RNA polymerase sigma factor n=1 Tax=Abyssisolibacter fermentans TaxID=1766203 RepID=UPI000833C9CB|nr:RNA polymerase sigma factor [Abyssisolibacter fermentans]
MKSNNIEEIVNEFQFRIYKYSYQMVRCKETAEDITQEVFIKFFQLSNKKQYNHSYLYTIAHNKCIDQLRKEKRKSMFLKEYKEKTHEALVENLVSKDKYSYELETILNTLTSYERSVFLLKSVNQLSYKEIAEILNKKEPALRKQFQRAKTKIERKLNKGRERYDNEEVSVF